MKKQSALFTNLTAAVLAASFAIAAPQALAHGDAHHPKKTSGATISKDEHAFGREGDAGKITRTIHVAMNDNMRFTPSEITVRQGETIRFIVRNKGKALHEMVIGTMDELKEHGTLMKKFPDMEHDAPYMAHVQPGGQEEMVWQFTKPGDFNFGCLAPGHFEAGMVGTIKVRKG